MTTMNTHTNEMEASMADSPVHMITLWWFKEERSWVCQYMTEQGDQINDAWYFPNLWSALYSLEGETYPIHIYRNGKDGWYVRKITSGQEIAKVLQN